MSGGRSVVRQAALAEARALREAHAAALHRRVLHLAQDDSLTGADIARRLGVAAVTVLRLLKRHGLPTRRGVA